MAKSGDYEVDAEGNLVGDREEPTPIPVRRALRVYGFAQLLSLAILLFTALTIPDLRPLLLILAALYAVVAFFLHRLFRRAMLRRYASLTRRRG